MTSPNTNNPKKQSKDTNEKGVVEENVKTEQVYDNPTFENGADNNKAVQTNGPPQDEKELVYDNADVNPGAESEGITKLDIDENKTSYKSPPRKTNAVYG